MATAPVIVTLLARLFRGGGVDALVEALILAASTGALAFALGFVTARNTVTVIQLSSNTLILEGVRYRLNDAWSFRVEPSGF